MPARRASASAIVVNAVAWTAALPRSGVASSVIGHQPSRRLAVEKHLDQRLGRRAAQPRRGDHDPGVGNGQRRAVGEIAVAARLPRRLQPLEEADGEQPLLVRRAGDALRDAPDPAGAEIAGIGREISGRRPASPGRAPALPDRPPTRSSSALSGGASGSKLSDGQARIKRGREDREHGQAPRRERPNAAAPPSSAARMPARLRRLAPPASPRPRRAAARAPPRTRPHRGRCRAPGRGAGPSGSRTASRSSAMTGSSLPASRAMIASCRTLGDLTLALVQSTTTSRAPISSSRIQLSQSLPGGISRSQNTS